MERQRLLHIDFLRSAAILIMLFANALPHISDFYCPLLLRIFCSLAAPTFIFLSGYTAALNDKKGRVSALVSAFGILTAAVLIDVLVWKIRPFAQFDVLYLISTGLIINIIARGSGRFQLIAGFFLLLAGPFLAGNFQYRFEIESSGGCNPGGLEDTMRRFLLDGWFPILPWLGFAFLGYAARKYRSFSENKLSAGLGSGLIAFVLMILWTLNSRFSGLREGYAEIFYPPSLQVMLLAFAWLWLVYHLFLLIQQRYPIAGLRPITLPGRHSLLIYNLHAVFLGPVMEISSFHPEGWQGAILTFLVLSFLCLLFAGFAEQPAVKNLTRKIPAFLRSVTGL